ncbi:CHASE2 domain-containing protein [Aerosakkonema funiforme]|uniref:Adenylate/guanylate cyclase domain-containing protein n=2 Tax=Oscillatoriophycideae TaxID=1301283 RepID=A0A926VFZ0_9CYAN|nr:adenylate/guanylate cyclase domain-containing protein [Aerosakkonema funiforme]MBD2183017.1 adenylate/guanylate cyclase domain-containing protein [Aerosakkonema funiforme FACHB-1375]
MSKWKGIKQNIWEWRAVLITTPSVTGFVFFLHFLGWLQPLEWTALNQFFRWRPLEPTDSRIVIVGINELDIQKVGQWPAPDAVLAKLLQKIKKQQPSAIGLDLYRDLVVNPGHQELVKIFETTPNLIGIEKKPNFIAIDGNKVEDKTSAVAPPPALKVRGQVAAADLVLDEDGKIRRGLLFFYTSDGKKVETLGLKLALIYLKQKNITHDFTKDNYIKIGDTVFTRFKSNNGAYVRADDGGYQVLLNFRGPAKSFRTVSMTDVIEDRIPPDLMRDRIVLIGATAASLKDEFYTPYTGLVKNRLPTTGVEIHANLTSQILSSVLDKRPLIKVWDAPLAYLWTFGWSALGATLSWKLRHRKTHTKLFPWTAASILLAGGILIGGSYLLFLFGWWVPLVPSGMALTFSAIAIVAYLAVSAAYIRQTFSRYLTDEVVARILETPEGLKLGGERRKVTILMSDLRGFSAVSERFAPEKVVYFLNIYLEAMVDVITHFEGTIDEFIGDAILVIFGAPTQREDDAQRSVACAIAMQLAMDKVNQRIKRLGIPKLEMGIGINTGEVVVGNIGSQKRAKYGVVGNHVNLTGRIESYTVGGQILISEFTLEEAGDIIKFNDRMQVEPKGIQKPITLYDVCGISGKYNLFLPESQGELFNMKSPISIQYTVLDGKHVVGTIFEARIIKLSANSAEVVSEHPADILNNIKINFLDETNKTGDIFGDVYAKVVKRSADSNTSFYIRFTAIPPDVAALISQLIDRNK